jgi:hypothetical protein
MPGGREDKLAGAVLFFYVPTKRLATRDPGKAIDQVVLQANTPIGERGLSFLGNGTWKMRLKLKTSSHRLDRREARYPSCSRTR